MAHRSLIQEQNSKEYCNNHPRNKNYGSTLFGKQPLPLLVEESLDKFLLF